MAEQQNVKHAGRNNLWTDQNLRPLHPGTSQLPERLVLEHILHSRHDAWPWQPTKQTNNVLGH